MDKDSKDSASDRGLNEEEVEKVEERVRPPTPVIYEIIREEGDEEMKRPLPSLFWSGIAAGLSIGFSLVAKAILEHHLPDADWTPLVSNFGYSLGFIIAILGRQQLFTENTVTPVLPLMADFNRRNLFLVARIWAIIFVANMIGTFVVALFNVLLPAVPPGVMDNMVALSEHMMAKDFTAMLVSGIGAGFLMATIVWLIPSAEGAKFFVILVMTWLIGVADFAHIVASSVEAFLLVLLGRLDALDMLWRFLVPSLLGNIIGGTALVALVAYGQVAHELKK